jgi:hypothetical protein
MKLYIEHNHQCSLPDDKKIVLTGVRIYQNTHKQWCLSFGSENHKYLDVGYRISTNALWKVNDKGERETERLDFYAHGFIIEIGEPDQGTWDWQQIFLVPESKEEEQELSGCAAVLGTKWSYQCVIVKFEDFWSDEDT